MSFIGFEELLQLLEEEQNRRWEGKQKLRSGSHLKRESVDYQILFTGPYKFWKSYPYNFVVHFCCSGVWIVWVRSVLRLFFICKNFEVVSQQVLTPLFVCFCDCIHFPNINGGCLETRTHFLAKEREWVILLAEDGPDDNNWCIYFRYKWLGEI